MLLDNQQKMILQFTDSPRALDLAHNDFRSWMVHQDAKSVWLRMNNAADKAQWKGGGGGGIAWSKWKAVQADWLQLST